MRSLGSQLGTTQSQDWVMLAALGLGAYVVYKLFGAASSVGQGIADVAQGVSSEVSQAGELLSSSPDPSAQTWAAWYDPTQRSVFVYVLLFPDGNHHLIWSSAVQPNGAFPFNSGSYRIGTDKTGGLRAYLYDPSSGDNPP